MWLYVMLLCYGAGILAPGHDMRLSILLRTCKVSFGAGAWGMFICIVV
jgi:hypothetical protein